MPSCQHADARWLSSHPRSRADGRTVPCSSDSAVGRAVVARYRGEGMR